MELNGSEGQKRAKINFKIPMKTSATEPSTESPNGKIEQYQSPILSEQSQYQLDNNKEIRQNDDSKPRDEQSDDRKAPKRKLIAETSLFGRNAIYPDELNSQILPLFCKLCNAALNSPKSAQFHYMSKSHEKKVTNWLCDWSTRTGEPVPKIHKDEVELSKDSSVLFCEYCSIKLTSLQDAKQHYSGKKHASKINVGRTSINTSAVPKNIGKKPTDIRFGIGESFRTNETESAEPLENKFCDICNIYTTSEQQLLVHQQGTKHLKKLKEINPEKAFAERDSQLSRDILNCRTPSGQFYCKTCNLTVQDDKIFSQHIVSKRHAKNLKKQGTEEAAKTGVSVA